MTEHSRRRLPALVAWPAAAVAVLGTLSVASCGGRVEQDASLDPPDATTSADASDDATDAADSGPDATLADAEAGTDIDVEVPVGGVCVPLRSDIDAGSADADAEPPRGGIC